MSEQSKVKHQKRYRYKKGVLYVNNIKQMNLMIRTVKIKLQNVRIILIHT